MTRFLAQKHYLIKHDILQPISHSIQTIYQVFHSLQPQTNIFSILNDIYSPFPITLNRYFLPISHSNTCFSLNSMHILHHITHVFKTAPRTINHLDQTLTSNTNYLIKRFLTHEPYMPLDHLFYYPNTL